MATQGTQGSGPLQPSAEGQAPSSLASAGLIADPAPLGLAAFGFTTLMLSAVNAGWIGAAATSAVLAMAIPFGGATQLLAGMWAFRRGNTFAATAFSSFGAFWISYFLLVSVFLPGVIRAGGAGEASQIVGLYLFGWGIFTAYMFVASLAGSRAVQLVFVLLALTFFALCAGEWAGSTTWSHVGGYLGMATAAAALYASFADVTNASFRHRVLPT
jgi:succinate-acetate transporter protein